MHEKVLLINPPGPPGLFRDTVCSTLSKAHYVWKPRGHILFSAVIPPDWGAAFVDATINSQSSEAVFDYVRSYRPTLAVVAISSVVWEKDYAFLKRLRQDFADLHIVVFGDAVRERYFFDLLLQAADEVFFNPLVYDIVNYRQKRFNSFALIEQPQIDKRGIPVQTYIPRHQLFDNRRYRWPFIKHFRYAGVYTQFGCPFSCSYCTSSRTSVTYRTAENVIEEIEMLYRDGYRELHFGDDTFGTPKENVLSILEYIRRKKYQFFWSAYTYPGIMDREFLELMKASGCHTLVIGIDSHDFSLLKKYGRQLPEEKLTQFLRHCRDLKIDVCGDFILGLEEEDEVSILKTIEFAIASDVDYASFNCANPLFGTSVRDQKKAAGIILEGAFGYDTAGYHIPGTTRLSSERLRYLHALAVKRFYFRTGYLLRRISRIRSLEELLLRTIEGLGVVKNMLATQ